MRAQERSVVRLQDRQHMIDHCLEPTALLPPENRRSAILQRCG
jgi:hypothetical protein